MKHTPGPWRYKEEPHHKWKTCKQFIIDSDDRGLMFLGEVYEDKNDPGQLDEVRANACLIAAAPELLAACQYVVNWHREHDSGDGELYGLDFVTTCISAIYKARRGES